MVLSPYAGAMIEKPLPKLAALRVENAALKEEIAELRRRLGKDSSNSSKPPSSDGSAKKPRIAGSLRGILGEKERRSARTSGRHAACGDQSRQDRTPRSDAVPAFTGGSDARRGHEGGEAAGVRHAAAAAGGDRASGANIHLRVLPRRDGRSAPRRCHRARNVSTTLMQ